MIVGGGNVGAGLALRLEKDYSVKLIERDQQRAAELAEMLHDTIVFYGDASDQELLAEEHIEQVDVFIAITNDDEANIMSAMLAKRMGAKKRWYLSNAVLTSIWFREALLILLYHRSKPLFQHY